MKFRGPMLIMQCRLPRQKRVRKTQMTLPVFRLPEVQKIQLHKLQKLLHLDPRFRKTMVMTPAAHPNPT
ncbi:hypothetical protein CUJ86_00735 [Methanofollis fontis]|uniref:Uncharacterized protein n=1 Tax=Methanofollis fontis TaxID=2052832 RepID=A0A483CUL4_9EURY|nr:hypothetical protein CUJ86_00735 [Methanofollis fontis]